MLRSRPSCRTSKTNLRTWWLEVWGGQLLCLIFPSLNPRPFQVYHDCGPWLMEHVDLLSHAPPLSSNFLAPPPFTGTRLSWPPRLLSESHPPSYPSTCSQSARASPTPPQT